MLRLTLTLAATVCVTFVAGNASANLGNIDAMVARLTPATMILAQPVQSLPIRIATGDACKVPSDHLVSRPAVPVGSNIVTLACVAN